MLIKAALRYYGTKELPGVKGNSRIVRWLQAIGFKTSDDKISWCSAFMHQIARECAAEAPEEKKGLARQWLTVGDEKRLHFALQGDVVVFKRGTKSWQGHVGLFICELGSHIMVLGGNQGNQVKIAAYPKSKLLGVRRLRGLGQLTCGE